MLRECSSSGSGRTHKQDHVSLGQAGELGGQRRQHHLRSQRRQGGNVARVYVCAETQRVEDTVGEVSKIIWLVHQENIIMIDIGVEH